MATSSSRQKPNILITGTPGTGKTSTSSLLSDATQLRHINISDLVREKHLDDGWDSDLQCHILNEDLAHGCCVSAGKEAFRTMKFGHKFYLPWPSTFTLVYFVKKNRIRIIVVHHPIKDNQQASNQLCDELEDPMSEGGNIVDYHGCDLFPERWFDLVVVLQTDNSILYDRLINRGYTGQKLQSNLECEIFQVLREEAEESYRHEIIKLMPSNTIEDMSNNVEILKEWAASWKPAKS